MTKHQQLKEDQEYAGVDSPVVESKKKSCNIWLLVATSQLIILLFLIMASCGVFNSSSSSSKESAAVSLMEKVLLDADNGDAGDNFDIDGESYLTGDQAPNIIFLIADDIGWADISHNSGSISTPNIDALLEDGVEFTNFYTHHSSTPSRMAFLTGRMAWRLGSQYLEELGGMMAGKIPFKETTFAEVTRQMGYDNYYVGQWGVGYASWTMTPLMRGWDKFMGYFGSEGGYYTHSANHFDEWLGVYDMWDM